MGIIGSLIIHVSFLFLSSYIYIGKAIQEEKIIEVEFISIPKKEPEKIVSIPKKTREPIIPSLEKTKRQRQLKEDELPPLRWQPKMPIQKELHPEKQGGLNLDIANIHSDIHIPQGEGRLGMGTNGEEPGIGTKDKEEETKGNREEYGLEITGEIAKRRVFYHEVFKIPEWLEKKGISLNGRFKFWVQPDGSVDRVVVLHSFGYRELDRLAMDAILRWRFCERKGGEEEWGITTIRIKLK